MIDAAGGRNTLSLDAEWRFVRDRHLEHGPRDLPSGEPIMVPGCWEAQVADPFGIVHAWLWRDIELPVAWPPDGDLTITFGAVMYRCEIWLDGTAIGTHEGGYTPFSRPLPDFLRHGVHRLAVRVTNPMNAITEYPALSDDRIAAAEAAVPELPISEIPHGKQTWYGSQSGIWRGVQIELQPSRRIERVTAHADWAAGRVEIMTSIHGPGGARLMISVRDPEGHAVADAQPQVSSGQLSSVLEIPDRLAWDVDAPNLYRAVVTLVIDETVVDEREVRFGFREIRTEAGKILLNGRAILIRGALDQDLYAGTVSTPPSRETIEEEMRLARAAGLNLLRCHIKVPDPVYLDVADETGMLLWCELPNWLRLTPASAARGKQLLEEMVDLIGSHPSVVIWTVVNEDWGTDLRGSASDRAWLRKTVRGLREMDPTRLVVDNSACPSASGPNFHLTTDLADFHRYAAMPERADHWREDMAEIANRPAWLWSPHGDAEPRGDEPVVLSEFGTWALPDPEALRNAWWVRTGDGAARPEGVEERFVEQRLDRVWPDLAALAAGTQRVQFDALRHQTAEIRRQPGMAGFVVTELTDANWEANGLLQLDRRPKLAHRRLAEHFGPNTLIVDLPRRDLWGAERVSITVTLSAETAGDGGELEIRLGTARLAQRVGPWGAIVPTLLGTFEIQAPQLQGTSDVELDVVLRSRSGERIAASRMTCAVLPDALRRTRQPLRIAVAEPGGSFGIADRVRAIGHHVTNVENTQLLVTSRVDQIALQAADAGTAVLVLARTPEAMPNEPSLHRTMQVIPRWPRDGGADGTWSGDWISAWSWILPELSPDLPSRAPLDFAYAEVLPDHVLAGYEPGRDAGVVQAGLFVGWLHTPVALVWRQWHGRAPVTATTFRLAPESGPVATVLLDALLRQASSIPPRAARLVHAESSGP